MVFKNNPYCFDKVKYKRNINTLRKLAWLHMVLSIWTTCSRSSENYVLVRGDNNQISGGQHLNSLKNKLMRVLFLIRVTSSRFPRLGLVKGRPFPTQDPDKEIRKSKSAGAMTTGAAPYRSVQLIVNF